MTEDQKKKEAENILKDIRDFFNALGKKAEEMKGVYVKTKK